MSQLGENSIQVRAGGEHAQTTIRNSKRKAEDLSAAVASRLIYHDDSVVRVAVQARDALYNAPSDWRDVTVVATLTNTLAWVGPDEVEATCTKASPSHKDAGVCIVSVTVPDEWFGGLANTDSNREATLTYGFGDGARSLWTGLGTVVLHARSTVVPGTNIVAYLPSKPVHPGGVFTVGVYANFEHLLETFTIDFGVDATMKIKQFDLAQDGGWSGTTANTGSIATLSYIRDGSGLTKDAVQEMELLATMQVEVLESTAPGVGSVSVFWNDTSNVRDETVVPEDSSVLVGRVGSSRTGSGDVHVEANGPQGLFGAAASGALVNTAVLNGDAISSGIDVIAILADGTLSGVDPTALTCTSSDARVIVASDGCDGAKITSQQDQGSPRVSVSVVYTGQQREQLEARVPFAVWAPAVPIQVALDDPVLQAVAGWHSAANCSKLYQQTRVRSSAAFGTAHAGGGGGVVAAAGPRNVSFTLDVSSHLHEGQVSVRGDSNGSASAVARIITGSVVVGESAGAAVVKVVRADGTEIGSADLTVDSQTVRVIGLEAHVVRDLSASVQSTAGNNVAEPFESLAVSVLVDEGPLTYEGDEAEVVVAAHFADGSIMPLDGSMGLVLSTDNVSVVVQGDSHITVPFMGASGAGNLVHAEWVGKHGSGRCTNDSMAPTIAEGYAFATVSLPTALSATVRIMGYTGASPALFVVPGDPGAAAGLATEATIVVQLEYAGRTIDVTSDPRTHFNLTGVPGMFTVDKAAKQIRATPGSAPGQGRIRVQFDHEAVEAEVLVEVAAFAKLQGRATPYPRYAGSDGASATTVSLIGGSSPLRYEQAEMRVQMEFSNGHQVQLDSSVVKFAVPVGASIVSAKGPVITGLAAGTAQVTASFSGHSAVVSIQVLDTFVHVASIDAVTVKQGNRLLGDSRALHGVAGVAHGQAYVSVTLDNNRKFETLFDTGGDALVPGLITFSADTGAVSVDSATGVVTLVSNHWTSAGLAARAVGSSGQDVKRTARFECNLVAGVSGDVDLGATDGRPLATRRVNDEFEVPLRVHTGGMYLGTFDIYLAFNSTILSIDDPKQSVTFNQNKQQIGSGILDAVVDGGLLHFSGSIDTKTLSGTDALLVRVKFRALRAGTTAVGGTVELLGSTAVPANDIAVRGSSFVAGQVYQTVTSGRQQRGLHAMQPGVEPHSVLYAAQVSLPQRRRRSVPGCAQDYGDTNADCTFDVNDVRFVTQYLAYRGINFVGGDGPTVQSILAGSDHSRRALDADHNSEVTGKDSSFLNKVNLGIFVFVEHVGAVSDGCTTRFTAEMYAKGNTVVDVSKARLYFDIAVSNSDLQATFDGMATPVGKRFGGSKGSAGALAGAVCAVQQGKTVCSVVLEAPDDAVGALISAGVSVGQVVAQNQGAVEVKFMSGREKPPFEYITPFRAELRAFDHDVLLTSSGSAGYSPLQGAHIDTTGCTTTTTTRTTTTTTRTTTTTTTTTATTTTTTTSTTTTTLTSTTTTATTTSNHYTNHDYHHHHHLNNYNYDHHHNDNYNIDYHYDHHHHLNNNHLNYHHNAHYYYHPDFNNNHHHHLTTYTYDHHDDENYNNDYDHEHHHHHEQQPRPQVPPLRSQWHRQQPRPPPRHQQQQPPRPQVPPPRSQ